MQVQTPNRPVHTFEHQAMATQFVLKLVEDDMEQAHWIAGQCFRRLDDLERTLSRFVPDSDVSRINRMKAGTTLPLDYETWELMKLAISLQQLTHNAFNVGVAEHMNIFRAAKQGILNAFEMNNALARAQREKEEARFFLDPVHPKIHCEKTGMQFDMGGIG